MIKVPSVRTQYGNVASITGVIVNLLVCLGELIVGWLIGSIAMISDGIHNVADAGGSAISFLSFRLAAKKPDQEHPYGHGRMEYLFSIGFSIILFVLAIQLMIEAVNRIMHPEIVDVSAVAIIVMLVAMGLKIWLSSFLKYMGNRIDSPILRANALECLSDVWATAGITIGLLAGSFLEYPIDGYLGAIVALMIGRAGYHVFKESTSRLLGNEPTPERVREIADFVQSFDGVLGVHDLMIHDYGPGHEFASIHVEVDANQDIIKSHNMIDHIERKALEELHLKLTIHMDKYYIEDLKVPKYTKNKFNSLNKVLNDFRGKKEMSKKRNDFFIDLLKLDNDSIDVITSKWKEPRFRNKCGDKNEER